MDRQVNRYYTNNLSLSAALIAEGVKLTDYSRNGKIVTFEFEDTQCCQEIEHRWLTNSLSVLAFDYSVALKKLKAIVYGEAYGTT